MDRYLHVLHIGRATVKNGERFFSCLGALTICFARFVAGLRIVAGPLAGTLEMPWKRFLLFNFLGAMSWVTVIACGGTSSEASSTARCG